MIKVGQRQRFTCIVMGVMNVLVLTTAAAAAAGNDYPNATYHMAQERDDKGSIYSSFENRQGRVNLVSFNAIDKDLHLGMDISLPFLSVPLKREADRYGQTKALVNINSAAIVTSVLIGGGGLLAGYVLKVLGIGRTQGPSTENPHSTGTRRRDVIGDNNYMMAPLPYVLESLRLMYTNTSGSRVEISMPNLLYAMETNILSANEDVDMNACVQKAICLTVHKAHREVLHGRGSGLQKIVTGISRMSWLLDALREQSALYEAINGGRRSASIDGFCERKYLTCKWREPEEKFADLLENYVRFL